LCCRSTFLLELNSSFKVFFKQDVAFFLMIIMNRTEINKCNMNCFTKRCFASVKLVCNAGEARPGGALAQALGPHHVKPAEFATEFNKLTNSKFLPGLPVGCRLKVTQGGKFTLRVCPPSFSTLTLGAVQKLGYVDLWWIIKYRLNGVNPSPRDVRTLIGTLKSFQKHLL